MDIEKIKTHMCDNYCKHFAEIRATFEDIDRGQEELDRICEHCPLNELEVAEMNDLIRRQDAIDALERIFDRCEEIETHLPDGDPDKTGYKMFPDYMIVWKYLCQLPSVQQWIPCSERLPEDIKPVIVTWKNNNPPFYYQHIVGEHFTGVAHYKNSKWFWYSSVTEDVLAEYGRCDSEEVDRAIEVIAWMPLPGPWKGEADEQIH